MDQDHLTFACANCGSDQFKGLTGNNQPDDVITCAGCGAVNAYGVLHKSRMEQGKKVVEDAFREAFKGIKGFKLSR